MRVLLALALLLSAPAFAEIPEGTKSEASYEIIEAPEVEEYKMSDQDIANLPTTMAKKVDAGDAVIVLIGRTSKSDAKLKCERSHYWVGFEFGSFQTNRKRYGFTYRCFEVAKAE